MGWSILHTLQSEPTPPSQWIGRQRGDESFASVTSTHSRWVCWRSVDGNHRWLMWLIYTTWIFWWNLRAGLLLGYFHVGVFGENHLIGCLLIMFIPLFLWYYSPPARWGSLFFNQGAIPSPSSSFSPGLLRTPLWCPPPSSSSELLPWTDPTHMASAGCCGGRLDPNTCQIECSKECENMYNIYIYN